jgi:hypothetical protein
MREARDLMNPKIIKKMEELKKLVEDHFMWWRVEGYIPVAIIYIFPGPDSWKSFYVIVDMKVNRPFVQGTEPWLALSSTPYCMVVETQ